MKKMITLPDGKKLDISEVVEVSPIVKFPEAQRGAGNLLGFSISMEDGAMLNVVRSFNEHNFVKINNELSILHSNILKHRKQGP